MRCLHSTLFLFCLLEDKMPVNNSHNKPSTSKECSTNIEETALYNLEPEQERVGCELAAILDDSDCSIKDKDYVPGSDSSSEEGIFFILSNFDVLFFKIIL